jgi:predicted CoA-binding protein
MNEPGAIDRFLASTRFAVLGASTDREKYGNKVLRCYLQHGREVIPVNPKEPSVEGVAAVKDIASVPGIVEAVSIITPPSVTEAAIPQLAKKGVKRLWMQPGAESATAIRDAEAAGMEVIAGGPCLLVVMGYHE